MNTSEKTLIIGSVIAVALIAVVIYYGANMTGRSMSDASTPSYIAAKFTCANGGTGDVISKNCRPESYWRNYADKFCRDLCELDLDPSVDNADNADPSCRVASFNIGIQCVGAPPRPPSCIPNCIGKDCGDDGCGGTCGTCSGSDVCMEGICQTPQCIPDCSGRVCGPDPICGESCGECSVGEECDAEGQCVTAPPVYQENPNSWLATSSGDIFMYYTKPFGITSATWKVKHGNFGPYDIEIPSECWNADPQQLSLKIHSNENNGLGQSLSQPYCFDGTNWIPIGSFAVGSSWGENYMGYCNYVQEGGAIFDGDWNSFAGRVVGSCTVPGTQGEQDIGRIVDGVNMLNPPPEAQYSAFLVYEESMTWNP